MNGAKGQSHHAGLQDGADNAHPRTGDESHQQGSAGVQEQGHTQHISEQGTGIVDSHTGGQQRRDIGGLEGRGFDSVQFHVFYPPKKKKQRSINQLCRAIAVGL